VLAFEIAQRMAIFGTKVKGVILIDSPSPINHKPLPGSVVDHVLCDVDSKTKQILQPQFLSHARMLSQYSPSTDRSQAKFALLQSQETLNTSELCGVAYPWLENPSAQADAILQWESLIQREVRILPIPGNHFEPFKAENVSAL
jgi:thioesterase domain-containing protein